MSEFTSRQYYKRKSMIIKMRRKIAHARKRIRRFRMLIRVTLIFGMIYFCQWILNLGMWYLNPNDILELKPVVVKIEGTLITPVSKVEQIVRTTDIQDEQIFKYSTKELEKNLLKLQPVQKAYVRRFWFPARIIVFIEERVPVFLITPKEDTQPIFAITKDGHHIDREYMPIPSKFKTTKILSYGTRGDDYEKWDKRRVDEISRLVKTIETYSKQEILYLDLRNKNDIYVKLEDVLLRLGTIDDTTDGRIKQIPTILPKAKTLGQDVQYIDLRWKDAYYIKLEKSSKQDNEKDKEKDLFDIREKPEDI